MKKICLIISCLFVVFTYSGCAPVISSGKKFNMEQVPRIQDGKTTKEEILSMFGQPFSKTLNGGTEMWLYMYTEMNRRRTFKESFARDFGLSMSLPSPKTQSLTVMFRNNVVESYSVSVSGDEQ